MAAEICALCGIRPATTREHVPAQQLWDPPRPNDLITVPACELCNKGTQKDDDYFRATLSLINEPTPSAALERVRPTVTRSFARPEAKHLAAHFAERVKFAPLGDGVIQQPVINPDSKRLNNEVGKHAVGLYYEVAGRPLSPAYGTIVLPWRWLDRIPAEDRPVWESVRAWALRGERRAIGDGSVFEFALKVADDNADGFVALLVYYRNFVYAVRSYERPSAPATP
jgi:hypothetical protein